MKFQAGDLVTLSSKCSFDNKHTAIQCKMGIVLSCEEFDNEILYKVHWWPFNQTFYFVHTDLRLVSRIFMQKNDKFGIIINDDEDLDENN